MPLVPILGVNIEYRLIPGDAGKPWLVFLHEGLGSVSLWRDFPDKAARRLGAPALVYSRRGYGQSDGLDGPRRPDYLHREALDVLPALLAHFGIARPILVGHSDGASIALIYAGTRPDALAAAAIMAPHVVVEALSLDGIRAVRQVYATSDLRQRLARHHAHVDDAFDGWSLGWLSPDFADWSIERACAAITCPLLLVQGTRDEYGSLVHVERIAALAQGPVESMVLEGVGHTPHREREAEVIEGLVRLAGQPA